MGTVHSAVASLPIFGSQGDTRIPMSLINRIHSQYTHIYVCVNVLVNMREYVCMCVCVCIMWAMLHVQIYKFVHKMSIFSTDESIESIEAPFFTLLYGKTRCESSKNMVRHY